MKISIYLALLMAFAGSSCTPDSNQPASVVNSVKETEAVLSENQTIRTATSAKEESASYQTEDSFIGKTNIELEKMGLFACRGSLIDVKGKQTNYAVSIVAKTQKECNNGAGRILLERSRGREGNKAVFEIVDEIKVLSNYPSDSYTFETCKIKGQEEEAFHVLQYKYQKQTDEQLINELWAIDLAAGKFKKIKNPGDYFCYDLYGEAL